MRSIFTQVGALLFGMAFGIQAIAASAADDEPGFKSLFNGQDLKGWSGRPQHWSVEDGAITGVTTKENPAQGNNFLIAKDGDQNLVVSDFELRFSYRFTGPFGNSGVQYRSADKGNYVVHGYQGDLEVGPNYSGILYEEGGRGILAQRGQKVIIKEVDSKTTIDVVGSVGDTKTIQAQIKTNGWNEYVVIAKGNHLQHFINGLQTVDVVDEQSSKAARSGVLALQLHAGPPMKVQYKNIRIKPLDDGGDDLAKMQGDWVPTEVVANGELLPKEVISGLKLTIKGAEYFLQSADQPARGSFKLKASTSPKSIDVTTDSGDRAEGIYELSGDTLRVCHANNGGARPTEFKSEAGADRLLATYKRKH
jgi:uncharacterized protein (TIGR03067 family)